MSILERALQLLIVASIAFLLVSAARAESAEDGEDDIISGAGDGGDVGMVLDGEEDFFSGDSLTSANGVETVYHFPHNPEKSFPAGDTQEILVGINNLGEFPLKVTSMRASLNMHFDHRIFVQNFTVQEFANATVPTGAQSSFAYSFTINKYLQPGGFSLVASIFYDVEDQAHKSVFYNGTVEVVEASGFFSGETLFLITLGLGLLGLLGMWVSGQVQRLSKKSRRTNKVETGTRSTDASSNEWLQGTSYTAKLSKSISQQSKSKKKK